MYNYNDVINSVFEIVHKTTFNITEEDIFNLLKIRNRWPREQFNGAPTLEVISEWKGKNVDEIFDSRGYLIYERWKKYYDLGFTTILSDVFDLTEELRNLQEELIKISGYQLHGNFYFSNGSDKHRVSFDHHNHEYDVMVKMIYGKCKWKIDDDYIDMEDSTIYIPSGTDHSVVECNGKKLSLTINLG